MFQRIKTGIALGMAEATSGLLDDDYGINPIPLAMTLVGALMLKETPRMVREEWQERTTVGRLGFLLATPIHVFMVAVLAFGTLVGALMLTVQVVPRAVWYWYLAAAKD